MKTYTILAALVAAALCTGCGLWEAVKQTAAEPAVIEPIIKIVEKLPETVATGEWGTTAVAGTSAVSALVIGALTKWLHGRMKKSQPGAIIG
jgi:ABC-type sulfate transport system permease component